MLNVFDDYRYLRMMTKNHLTTAVAHFVAFIFATMETPSSPLFKGGFDRFLFSKWMVANGNDVDLFIEMQSLDGARKC